jgi:hypothetical protein
MTFHNGHNRIFRGNFKRWVITRIVQRGSTDEFRFLLSPPFRARFCGQRI